MTGGAGMVVEDKRARSQAPRMTGPEARPDVRGSLSSTSMALEGGRGLYHTIISPVYVRVHVQDAM